MKISGYGSGPGSSPRDNDRKERFRRKYAVGQKIRGKLIRWERPGLAWVNFEGQQLLARLSSSPPLGEVLLFLIKSLEPEIQLQELHAASLEVHASDAARTLAHARSAFESGPWMRAIQGVTAPLADWRERRSAFFSLLERDNDALARYQDALAAEGQLNLALKNAKLGRVACRPWLIPAARKLEILDRTNEQGKAEMVMGFHYPGIGPCRVLASHGAATGEGEDNRAEFRLGLPRETPKAALDRIIAALNRTSLKDCRFLGATALPLSAGAGPLAELVAALLVSRGRGSSGLNIKA